MRNGVIYKSDGDRLMKIYKAIDIDGLLNRQLTIDEQVLLFSVAQAIQETVGKPDKKYTMTVQATIERDYEVYGETDDDARAEAVERFKSEFSDGMCNADFATIVSAEAYVKEEMGK